MAFTDMDIGRNISEETIINKIYLVRGHKVMLDRDLAKMYDVETRVLNQAIKQNEKRFPADFMFQTTSEELSDWKSQNVISNKEKMGLRKPPSFHSNQPPGAFTVVFCIAKT